MAILPTSGSYNSLSVPLELIIREAYERIGVMDDMVVPQQLVSAQRSINFLLAEWSAKDINLWTLQSSLLPLIQGQAGYTLPIQTNDLTQANVRTSTRQLNGVAGASEGTAANAFNDDPLTSCVQTQENGWIEYSYGIDNKQVITFVGIRSNVTIEHPLAIESDYLVYDEWETLVAIPSNTCIAGVTTWFEVPTPISALRYRIKASVGGVLNINKIYFNNNIQDTQITEVSRSEYFSYPQPNLISRPSVYYLDRQIQPVLYLWPTPSAFYNVLIFSWTQMIQDCGALGTNTLQIPARFYQALVWGLSWHLAVKTAPDRAQMLKAEYEQAFESAARQDTEGTPIRIYGDYTAYAV